MLTSLYIDIAFRHGDLEDVLLKLGKVVVAAGMTAPKFTKADVQRIYFVGPASFRHSSSLADIILQGNWLRDYSQLMDITGLRLANGSRETILLIVQILSFMVRNPPLSLSSPNSSFLRRSATLPRNSSSQNHVWGSTCTYSILITLSTYLDAVTKF